MEARIIRIMKKGSPSISSGKNARENHEVVKDLFIEQFYSLKTYRKTAKG
jgi:hypothetical protein